MQEDKINFPENKNIVFDNNGEEVNLSIVPLKYLNEIKKEVQKNKKSKYITDETLNRIEKAIFLEEVKQIKSSEHNKNSFGSDGLSYFPGYEEEDDKFIALNTKKLYNRNIIILKTQRIIRILLDKIPAGKTYKKTSSNKLWQTNEIIKYRTAA